MSKKDYKPYIDLLKTIYYSDDDKEYRNSCIVVYDIYDDEKPIAVFSKAKYCAKFFNTTEKTIGCCICRSNLRNHRYKIERIYLEEE